MISAGKTFRRVLAERTNLVLLGGFDPLSTVLVQNAGYPVAYLGGWATGAHLCISEPLTTLTEQVEAAARCTARLHVPLVVDGGAGFGDPLHAARALQEFERAGVAGIHVEDQIYPKRMHYHRGREHIIPLEEFLLKLRASLHARKDPDFVLIGRTDARHAVGGSFEECVRRCLAMREAGVDILMPMLDDLHEMRELRRQVPDIPLVALARPGSVPVSELHAIGYPIVIFPSAVVLAAMGGVLEVLQDLRETGQVRLGSKEASETRTQIEHAMQLEQLLKLEAETVER